MTFYSKLPKAITDLSAELRKVIEKDSAIDHNQTMEFYFKKYWAEFKEWWRKTQSEQIDWITFVAASPENAEYFTQYCFQMHPETRLEVRKALDGYYLMSKPADKQTEKERELREVAMYGCTQASLDSMAKKTISGVKMLAMSILSDAQEVMAHNPNESAQFINRAKYIIDNYLTALPK